MTIKCKFCDVSFSELKRFESHLIQDHSDLTSSQKLDEFKRTRKDIVSSGESTYVRKAKRKVKVKKVKPTYLKIEVISKKGIKVREEQVCNSCSKSFRVLWNMTRQILVSPTFAIPVNTEYLKS